MAHYPVKILLVRTSMQIRTLHLFEISGSLLTTSRPVVSSPSTRPAGRSLVSKSHIFLGHL